jgi:hypothetical protein
MTQLASGDPAKRTVILVTGVKIKAPPTLRKAQGFT